LPTRMLRSLATCGQSSPRSRRGSSRLAPLQPTIVAAPSKLS
jgi:hypothetical protein